SSALRTWATSTPSTSWRPCRPWSWCCWRWGTPSSRGPVLPPPSACWRRRSRGEPAEPPRGAAAGTRGALCKGGRPTTTRALAMRTADPIAPMERESAPTSSRPQLENFARRVVVALLLTVLIVGLAYLFWRGLAVLLQAFAGVLFAVLLVALA